ncbi:type II toxin-antitoxin system PemK/MazF family toxin [uncultured Rhodospira sp.]|uniref:type II toxin-antitoxin system PemK/MazF family toxin n=1 Tax=uncultured Rhodospira sp. TaxID=1936189 RepID=UPI0026032551|nr:type II toxin-antitoxin system PemK/MazF family toxin [uncultured Rhodospira sp.]
MADRFVPDAGDVVWLAFDPQAGHEQRGRRPALVLSQAAPKGRAAPAELAAVRRKAIALIGKP